MSGRGPRRAWLGWIPPLAACALGGVYCLLRLAEWAGASLPYQDAPPALLARQAQSIEQAAQGAMLGALVAGGGIGWALTKWLRARAAIRGKERSTPR